MHEHDWTGWGPHDDAVHIHSCDCGATQTEEHHFDDGAVINWATHLAPGEIHFTCMNCGYAPKPT